jgi:hypothetical protein
MSDLVIQVLRIRVLSRRPDMRVEYFMKVVTCPDATMAATPEWRLTRIKEWNNRATAMPRRPARYQYLFPTIVAD